MKILPDSNYKGIYTGSSIKANYLKTLLEDDGIQPILRNDGESARTSGFMIDYANEVKMLVHKKDVLKAKHILQSALDENGDIVAISEEDLEKQAMASKPTPIENDPNKQKHKRRSPLNLLLNAGLIVYSLWRLSPLLKGESLNTLRIVVSSSIILFCSWTLINHFRK